MVHRDPSAIWENLRANIQSLGSEQLDRQKEAQKLKDAIALAQAKSKMGVVDVGDELNSIFKNLPQTSTATPPNTGTPILGGTQPQPETTNAPVSILDGGKPLTMPQEIPSNPMERIPQGMTIRAGKGITLKNPKSGVGGFGSAMINQAEKNAPAIAEAVMRGDYVAFDRADRYTQSATSRLLSEKGFDITTQGLQYRSKEAMSKGSGVQNLKVDQAIHLRALADQYYDPQTKNYNIPQVQFAELAMGLANLVSNSNQTTDAQRKEIMQRTATGDMNGLVSYLTGSPKNASSQEMFKNLIDSIDRQGEVANQEREAYTGKTSFGSKFIGQGTGAKYLNSMDKNKERNQPDKKGEYSIGQIITGKNGKNYKITGGDLTDINNIDVEEVTNEAK